MAVRAIVLLVRSSGGKQIFDTQRVAVQFLQDNYGGVTPSLQDVLRPKKLKLKGALRPTVMGNSLGEISFDSDGGSVQPEVDALTDAIIDCATTLMSQIGVKKVFLHFDELDQGLSAIDEQHEKMIIGLVLAARLFRSSSIAGKPAIFPVAYLRTDIWDEFRFSDKNKISQSSAVLLEWDSDTLQAMVNQRIKVKLGERFSWNSLDDGSLMRGSQPKWNHIIARTFLRPRDVIQFLNCALAVSLSRDQGSNLFDNEDIQVARESYSRYLKQELDDELGPHWDRWSEALQACSELATITFSRDDFLEAYGRRKTKKNDVSGEDALELLYQFSVIGYRRGIGKGGSGWVFQYSDPHAGWDNGASLLKVHLGLKEFAKLREERA